jgi:hypothetical protein
MAAAALALVGCGATQPTPPVGSRANDRELAAALFPDAAYEAGGVVLFQAQERLTRRCMTERGWPYRGSEAALPPPPGADALPDRDAGYGLAARIARADPAALRNARAPERSPQARLLAEMSPRRRAAYERALVGDGRPRRIDLPGAPGLQYAIGGCTARALTRLYGAVRAYYRALTMRNAVAGAVNQRLERDRRSLVAGHDWRRCMAASGHRVRSPNDARERVYHAYIVARETASVRPRERAMAVTDRRCGLRSGFYREQTRARRAALGALSPQHVRWANAWTRLRAQALRRARAVML